MIRPCRDKTCSVKLDGRWNLLGHKRRWMAVVKFSSMISQIRRGGVDVVHLMQNWW
jgi:hypothetical protein